MKTSMLGRAFIRACEGCRLRAYRDSVGVLTIGVGHTSAAGQPVVDANLVITNDEADQILSNDLRSVEHDIERMVTAPLKQDQFDAIVSWVFNLGIGNLAKSTLLKKLNVQDYSGAADEFLKWDRAGGRVLSGLVKRRKAERLLFLGRADEALRLIGAKPKMPQKKQQIRKTAAPAAVIAATTAAVIAATTVVASQSHSWPIIAAIVGAGIILAVLIYLILHKNV